MKRADALRIKHIYIFFLFLFLTLALRISYLQIYRKASLRKLSQNQYYRLIRLEGGRGRIIDRRGIVLARNINSYSIFADPLLVDDPDYAAGVLSLNLNLPEDKIKERLKRKKRFVWIKRKISNSEKEKVESLKLRGIGFIREKERLYPQEDIASSVLGIVDIDNRGLEGLELFYDKYLRGKEGWARVLQDSSSQKVILKPQILSPQRGADIILTLDAQIQYWAQKYLQETVRDFGAKGGSVVVMDAQGGEILAVANYLSSDHEGINNNSLPLVRNSAIADYFEPGSVFKVVTLIAALEERKFSEEDKVFCENGQYKISGRILHDWKPYGELKFKEVFQKSSNIGVAKIAHSLGRETLYSYVRKLGFGKKTGIDLPGESGGKVRPLKEWSRTSEYIVPIGQEIGVNLLQLSRAFALVVNGGHLLKPHIVKTIYSPFFTKDISGEERQVISPSSAQRAKKILIAVVEEGTGRLARIQGLTIGGKTGTGQKYDRHLGRYSPNKYRATFVGFLSDLTPPLVIGVTIDEPKKHHFGGVVAAPLFKKIAEKISGYLEGERALASK